MTLYLVGDKFRYPMISFQNSGSAGAYIFALRNTNEELYIIPERGSSPPRYFVSVVYAFYHGDRL